MLTVYQRVLGERFELLHPALRRFLEQREARARGRFRVTRARGWLRNLIAAALGVPPAGEYDMVLEVSPHGDDQRWRRRFGDSVLETGHSEHRGLLVESSGAASIGFEVIVEGGGMLFRPRRAWMFGIRLPLWLAPRIEAENWPNPDDSWRVHVRFSVPLLGRVAEYEGDVEAG